MQLFIPEALLGRNYWAVEILGPRCCFLKLRGLFVDFWVNLSRLVLVYYERKTLLIDWFGLAETSRNQ